MGLLVDKSVKLTVPEQVVKAFEEKSIPGGVFGSCHSILTLGRSYSSPLVQVLEHTFMLSDLLKQELS